MSGGEPDHREIVGRAAEDVGDRLVRREGDPGGRTADARQPEGGVAIACERVRVQRGQPRGEREGIELGERAVAFAGDEEGAGAPPVRDRARLRERRLAEGQERAQDFVDDAVPVEGVDEPGGQRLLALGIERGRVLRREEHVHRPDPEPGLGPDGAERLPGDVEALLVG
jgi:hypothetical protein